MDSKLQTLERAVAASPEEPAPFLRYLHYHTRVTGVITPQELLKVQELLYSKEWRVRLQDYLVSCRHGSVAF